MNKESEQQLFDAFNAISDERRTEIQELTRKTEKAILDVITRSKTDVSFKKDFIADPVGVLQKSGIGEINLSQEDKASLELDIIGWVEEVNTSTSTDGKISCDKCKAIISVIVVFVLVGALVVSVFYAPEVWIAILELAWFDSLVTAAMIAAIIGMTSIKVAEYACMKNGNCFL